MTHTFLFLNTSHTFYSPQFPFQKLVTFHFLLVPLRYPTVPQSLISYLPHLPHLLSLLLLGPGISPLLPRAVLVTPFLPLMESRGRLARHNSLLQTRDSLIMYEGIAIASVLRSIRNYLSAIIMLCWKKFSH